MRAPAGAAARTSAQRRALRLAAGEEPGADPGGVDAPHLGQAEVDRRQGHREHEDQAGSATASSAVAAPRSPWPPDVTTPCRARS